jgi:hypothetical protein
MDHQHDRKRLDEQRTALIARIREAFKHVSRAGGISWSETVVIDNYGTDEERAVARGRDTERGWTHLLDDPAWSPEAGIGGFSFLDPIGFRYYLGAAMIRVVNSGDVDSTLAFTLTLPPDGDQLRSYITHQMSALDDTQRGSIAAFLRFMIEFSEAEDEEIAADSWREALMSAWNDCD